MKVYIEVPDNWIDAESTLFYGAGTIRDQMRGVIIQAVTDQLIGKMELPDIQISKEEIRAAVKERIVERMVDKAMV